MDTEALMRTYGPRAFHPDGEIWTWKQLYESRQLWGNGICLIFPFLEDEDRMMPGIDGICVEEQLAAIEQGWA